MNMRFWNFLEFLLHSLRNMDYITSRDFLVVACVLSQNRRKLPVAPLKNHCRSYKIQHMRFSTTLPWSIMTHTHGMLDLFNVFQQHVYHDANVWKDVKKFMYDSNAYSLTITDVVNLEIEFFWRGHFEKLKKSIWEIVFRSVFCFRRFRRT